MRRKREDRKCEKKKRKETKEKKKKQNVKKSKNRAEKKKSPKKCEINEMAAGRGGDLNLSKQADEQLGIGR